MSAAIHRQQGGHKQQTHKEQEATGIAAAHYDDVIISTANDIPGYRIIKVHGVVYGITVRSRNILSVLGAALKSIPGGELGAITTNMVRSRDQALDRMVQGVRQLGANAVYAFRFDEGSSPAPGWAEICCYGTAVTVRPLREEEEDDDDVHIPEE
jgi:uncharacterized protein YbjQ (UPF0145 family)